MADNYNVSVTLDSFNGIIIGNGDGTYNVTYTNLTNGQIDAIGAAIEKAVEDNLPEVALSGSYEDLDDIPENNEGKRQGFHEVAFTGEYSILEHKPDLKDLAFLNTVPYDKVDEAPSLINQPFIYDEENEQYTDEKAPFDRVAFTGNYEDLNHLPTLFNGTYRTLVNAPGLPSNAYSETISYPPDELHNEAYELPNYDGPVKQLSEIAFSGSYNSLYDVPISLNDELTLSLFSNNNISINESNKIKTLGNNDTYVINFSGFLNNEGGTLSGAINDLTDAFLEDSKQFYIITDNQKYFINNIQKIMANSNTISYIRMDFLSFNQDNYDIIRYNGDNFTNTIAQDQLNNLTLINQMGYFIFDYINDVIYCKTKTIN